MNSIFEIEEIWYIILPGLGRAYIQEHNVQAGRIVICQACRGDIQTGAGYRFKRERYTSGFFNGFICQNCIAEGLRKTARWHFNASEGILYKANGYTSTPIDGHQLAAHFTLTGALG